MVRQFTKNSDPERGLTRNDGIERSLQFEKLCLKRKYYSGIKQNTRNKKVSRKTAKIRKDGREIYISEREFASMYRMKRIEDWRQRRLAENRFFNWIYRVRHDEDEKNPDTEKLSEISSTRAQSRKSSRMNFQADRKEPPTKYNS